MTNSREGNMPLTELEVPGTLGAKVAWSKPELVVSDVASTTLLLGNLCNDGLTARGALSIGGGGRSICV